MTNDFLTDNTCRDTLIEALNHGDRNEIDRFARYLRLLKSQLRSRVQEGCEVVQAVPEQPPGNLSPWAHSASVGYP